MCVYVYIYIYICIYIYIYIYTHILSTNVIRGDGSVALSAARVENSAHATLMPTLAESYSGLEMYLSLSLSLSLYIYIYIYTHICV